VVVVLASRCPRSSSEKRCEAGGTFARCVASSCGCVPAVVTAIVGVFLVVGVGLRLPGIWRTGRVWGDAPPGWWPWGVAGYRAYARAAPTLCVWMAVCVPAVLTGSRVLLAAVIALTVLAIVVALVNRPRFVVPPARRGDPGLLARRGQQ
jgi:hypothetical protein